MKNHSKYVLHANATYSTHWYISSVSHWVGQHPPSADEGIVEALDTEMVIEYLHSIAISQVDWLEDVPEVDMVLVSVQLKK